MALPGGDPHDAEGPMLVAPMAAGLLQNRIFIVVVVLLLGLHTVLGIRHVRRRMQRAMAKGAARRAARRSHLR
jgi:hypothetical protein